LRKHDTERRKNANHKGGREIISMKKLIALIVIAFIWCPGLGLAADGQHKGGSAEPGNLAGATFAGTTVRSGKSNSSDRVGPAGENTDEGGSADRASTVKSSKSNSSERVGPAGGSKDEGGTAGQATTVKGSKSNTSE
jgi:hypothetical protein